MDRLRLILATLLFAGYYLCMGILWLERIDLQFVALGGALALCFIALGRRKTFRQLLILLPFVLSLLLAYAVLILLRISPGAEPAFDYWLAYGLPRLLLLISSLLAFRFCASLLSYRSLLHAIPGIRWQKYLILGRLLGKAAFQSYPTLRYWQSMIPSRQISPKGMRQRWRNSLAGALALALYVMEEARHQGEAIDNRIQCCHKEKP